VAKTKQPRRKGRPTISEACALLRWGSTKRARNGWRVVFAKFPMLVPLKQEHIDEAIPGDPQNCAFALAFRAMFPNYDVHILRSRTRIISPADKVELRLQTPRAVAEKLQDFDTANFWDLPPKEYVFDPVPRNVAHGPHITPNGKNKKKPETGVRVKVKRVRRVVRVFRGAARVTWRTKTTARAVV
jgi:hypothetical protein